MPDALLHPDLDAAVGQHRAGDDDAAVDIPYLDEVAGVSGFHRLALGGDDQRPRVVDQRDRNTALDQIGSFTALTRMGWPGSRVLRATLPTSCSKTGHNCPPRCLDGEDLFLKSGAADGLPGIDNLRRHDEGDAVGMGGTCKRPYAAGRAPLCE